jgi:DNA-binding MarR family transcriptional regulator
LWHRELNARLGEIDLTEMQFVILMGLGWILELEPKGVSQKELAASCSCSPALASQVIKSLVRKKLVSTARDKADGRAQVLTLTKQGEDRIRAALRVTDEADAEFWGAEPLLASELSDIRAALRISELAQNGDGSVGAMPGLADAAASPHRQTRPIRAAARVRR